MRMKMPPTPRSWTPPMDPEQLARLPKWAANHITTIERERDTERADAKALLAASRAWAERGWCAHHKKAKEACDCDWHMALAAVAQAEGRK